MFDEAGAGDGGWIGGYDLPGGGDASGGFDFLGTVGKIGGVLGNVATTITGIQLAKDSAAYQRQLTQSTQNLELAKVNGAVEVEKLRTAAQIQQQRQLLNGSPALSSFYPFSTGGGGNDTLMLLLTAAGVFFAWKALKK